MGGWTHKWVDLLTEMIDILTVELMVCHEMEG